jgi:DNA-binding CsgD family transcriptional regulator
LRLPVPVRTSAPAIRLAELRLRQGRIEEVTQLLSGLENSAAALTQVVSLHLAHGEAELAAEKVGRRLETAREESDVVLAELHLVQARVELARSNPTAAREALTAAAELASRIGRDDLLAASDVMASRAARLGDETVDAGALESAIERFSELGQPLEEGEARVELSRVLAAHRLRIAVEQAQAALGIFERLGAARHADETAALLRELGAPGRPAPRTPGTLTRREQDVLQLLREGLSNAEIARRLVISPRTAEHHVRSILGKLGLRNRAEAAAYAASEALRRPL